MGDLSRSLPSSSSSEWRTEIRPAARWTSRQRSPNASPWRNPVPTATVNSAASRCPAAAAKSASAGVTRGTSRRVTLGRSAPDAGLTPIRPHLTARLRQRDSTAWTSSRVRGETPPAWSVAWSWSTRSVSRSFSVTRPRVGPFSQDRRRRGVGPPTRPRTPTRLGRSHPRVRWPYRAAKFEPRGRRSGDGIRRAGGRRIPSVLTERADRRDWREQLFNDGDVGPISHVQLPAEAITRLRGFLLDIDPGLFRPEFQGSPKEFYEAAVRP